VGDPVAEAAESPDPLLVLVVGLLAREASAAAASPSTAGWDRRPGRPADAFTAFRDLAAGEAPAGGCDAAATVALSPSR
jgi:hypothetical protein